MAFASTAAQGDVMTSAIVVFSRLRWDFVYHRPQHLLSRLAEHYPVVFVEEPVHCEAGPFFSSHSPLPGVLVCRPHTPAAVPGFHDAQLPYLRKLLRQVVQDYDDHIAWFYAPAALPLLRELQARLVVYDCLVEAGTDPASAQRESELLKVADIVFACGPSLYRALHARHPNTHYFPNSVEAGHFVRALERANSHPAHRHIPGPRLGFHGVIDQRFDSDLVARLADAHPQWQIVLAGPVAGIDPAGLPRRPNLHYLGRQPYDALPLFLAGWDVCLLPFALNEATRFANPVKILEYMAAELPIVSTPVADVAEMHGNLVAIASDPQQFIAACEAALLAPRQELQAKAAQMRRLLAATSWNATAERMRALMESACRSEEPALPARQELHRNRLGIGRTFSSGRDQTGNAVPLA